MRRLLPGILVAVLGVGVVAGAALGESQRPVSASGTGSFSGRAADDWVDHVVATTTAAGSARFTDASTTESPDPAYRSTSHGSGVVDFTSGDFQVTEVNHEVTSEAARGQPAREVPQTLTDESIGIGRSLYLDFSLPVFNWVKFPEARYPHVALGLDQPAGAQVALGGLTGIAPVVSVRDLGPAMVRGVSTTRYRVINQS